MRLPVASMPIGEAFKLMQVHKTQLNVQEYSLSQTTLEQIFNQFAAQQEEETSGARGIVDSAATGGAAVMQAASPANTAQQPLVDVTVPPGVGTGQLLSVAGPDGTKFNVAVPEGLQAGQTFRVQCPAAPAVGSQLAQNNLQKHIV